MSQAQPVDFVTDTMRKFTGLITGEIFDAPKANPTDVDTRDDAPEDDTNGSGNTKEGGREFRREARAGNLTVNIGDLFREQNRGKRRSTTVTTTKAKDKTDEGDDESDEGDDE